MSFDSDDNQQVQTATSERPAWIQPYSEELLQRGQSLSATPWEAIPGGVDRVEGLSGAENLAIDMGTQRGTIGSPLNAQAGGTLADLMGGNGAAFSDLTNQLVANAQGSMVDQFNQNVAPSTAAAFNRANTLGSTGNMEIEATNRYNLARALGETDANIRGQALNRAMTAAGMAPQIAGQDWADIQNMMQLGGVQRSLGQSVRDADLERFLDIRQDPTRRLDVLGAALNTAGGGYSKTTTSQPGTNPWLDLAGAGASLMGGVGSLIGAFK